MVYVTYVLSHFFCLLKDNRETNMNPYKTGVNLRTQQNIKKYEGISFNKLNSCLTHTFVNGFFGFVNVRLI